MSDVNVKMLAMHISDSNREEHLKCELSRLKYALTNAVEKIKHREAIKYTGWHVLLKRTDTGWSCVGFVNENQDDPVPDGFDLVIPIPEPSTLQEFQGF